MKRALAFLSLVLLGPGAPSLPAQTTIVKKDGTTQTSKSLRREKDFIMATIDMQVAPGQPAATGEIGIPIAQIATIQFPEPANLNLASELLTQGKGAEALAQLDQALRYYEGFRDAPGSWWADLALLKANVLVSLGREKEAEPLAGQIARLATDPETIRGARVHLAAGAMRQGNNAGAIEALEAIIKESTRPDTLASAAVYKGQSHLGLKQWEEAVLSFLQVPVFYPDQKVLMPPSLLGSGQAYFGLLDLERAKATLNELLSTYAATRQAAMAKVELEKIARHEKANELPP